MKAFSFQEFKPSIFFLLKFLGLYFILNIIYGWFIHAWYPGVDPVTAWVTDQTSAILNVSGWSTWVKDESLKATALIVYQGRAIIAVFEGCNGLNVMIVYVAFLLGFGPMSKKLLWFFPLGLVVIHLVNLARIFLLFFVSIKMPDYQYFMHKYFFTAILYIAVFVLWIAWIRLNTAPKIESE